MQKKKVTNEEYTKILEEAADRAWKKVFALEVEGLEFEVAKRQIWKDFDKEAEMYEIIPFEINTQSETLKKCINNICTKETKKDNKTLYRGSFPNSSISYTLNNELGLSFIYNDAYQTCLYSKELNLFFEYAEGDVTFTLISNPDDFDNEKIRIEKFYENL